MKPDTEELKELGIALILSVAFVLAFSAFVVALGLVLVLWPIWLPLDYVLRHTGHYGFVRFTDHGTFSLIFTSEAFRRV